MYEIVDKATGGLKKRGWMKRDKNLRFNWEDVKKNPKNFWLREKTKVKHFT